MSLATKIGGLSTALRRVGNEYREAAMWRGERDFHVRVDLTGLTRPESSTLFDTIERNERIWSDRVHDPSLEAQRRSFLRVRVVGTVNITAACSQVLDVVRAALIDTGLMNNVERIEVSAWMPDTPKEARPEERA